MNRLLTPKQIAQALGVSESSLKRWCDRGLLPIERTPGGHRRIPLEAAVDFVRRSGRAVVQPDLLDLPAAIGTGPTVMDRARDQFCEALAEADEARATRIVFDLYLGRHPISEIGDRVIAGAFHQIGDKWSCGELDVYEERRACELAGRILHQIRGVMPPPPTAAPLALGGTALGDEYHLPTMLVELSLRECGWRAESCGSSLPLESLAAAVRRYRPKLAWLSVSAIADEASFLAGFAELSSAAEDQGVALVVGGRALGESLRGRLSYAAHCDTLRQLVTLAAALHPPAKKAKRSKAARS